MRGIRWTIPASSLLQIKDNTVSEWQWSHYSEALFDTFTSTQAPNIIVQACPGAGKTRNLEHLWSLSDAPTAYLVFAKANQLEAKEKLPRKYGSDILTINSFGHRALLNTTFGQVQFDDKGKKVLNIIKEHIVPRWQRDRLPRKTIREQEWSLKKMVDMAKQVVTDAFSIEDCDALADMYDMDTYPGMHTDVQFCLDISDADTTLIDYNDQIRIPALYKCNMPQYDIVLGDEWQDATPMQNLLIQHIGAKQYVLVGDRNQAIYGFRGAMSNSLDYAKQGFSCIELPLSITYRCAKNIVAAAAKIYKGIEVWDQSPDGIVRGGDMTKETLTKNDIGVCRMNRPLVTLAFDLLSRDIPCYVKGRDIGTNLVNLIQKQEATSIMQLMDRLSLWCDAEMAKAHAKDDDGKLQRIQDKYDTALVFCGKYYHTNSVDQLVQGIEDVFAQGKGVCLSTVHKAKGLEAQRCFVVEHGLHDYFASSAKQAWQATQEHNIKYVAVTRAREELVYV